MKSFHLLLFLTVGIAECHGQRPFDDEFSRSLVEKGRKQLNELEQKGHLPRYGECWLQALDHLRDGCATLTDSIQVDLALHLTDCFMDMSGQDRLDCVSERTEPLKRLCMSEMTDRAFAVYTEFFTQTQNMCYFLQAQRWQAEADRTIDRLSVSSRDVSERLQVASEVQRTVLEHQKEGLKLQEEMLVLGSGLAATLNGSQSMLDKLTEDLRNSTVEHQTVLAELFREFNLLHGWIVGRYAFVDRTIFYLTFLLAIMVATSTKRTQNSRTILLLILVASLLFELTLTKLSPSLDPLQRDQLLWPIRKLFLVISALAFFYLSYRYQDANTKLLNEIKEQNRQIMDAILAWKLAANNDLRPGQSSFFSSKKTTQTEHSTSSFNLAAGPSSTSYGAGPERTLRKIPLAPDRDEDATTVILNLDEPDYDKENSSNERRSVSRSVRSESSVSRTSRYNLRRKTIGGQQQQ